MRWCKRLGLWHRCTFVPAAVVAAAALAVGHGDLRARVVRARPPDCAPRLDVAREQSVPDLEDACGTDNPYLVTACYDDIRDNRPDPPIVVAFNHTGVRGTHGPHHTLATEKQVGAVWGLAYSPQRHAVYASAFHKRQMRFGPSGPGAIYRIDIESGQVGVLAVVPDAGPDHHEPSASRVSDTRARPWAGKTSLGDLDVNPEGTELYVTNLADRRIYRYSLPGGALLGSFAHGAAAEEWSTDARPFALKSYGGRLYHGVVNSAEGSQRRDDLAAYVYSSAPDGTDMREVARAQLTYPRGTIAIGQIWSWYKMFDHNIILEWRPWTDMFYLRDRSTDWDPAVVYPMPVLADIEFDAVGNMVLGLTDRALDMGLTPRDFDDQWVLYDWRNIEKTEWPAVGAGDTLLAVRTGDSFLIDTSREHYADGHKALDETNLAGLAMLSGVDQVVSAAVGIGIPRMNGWPWLVDRGAKWYENSSGDLIREESVCSAEGVYSVP